MWRWSCIFLCCLQMCIPREMCVYIPLIDSLLDISWFWTTGSCLFFSRSHYSPRNSLPWTLEMKKPLNLYLSYSIQLNRYFSTPCPPFKFIRTSHLFPVTRAQARFSTPIWNKDLNYRSVFHVLSFYSMPIFPPFLIMCEWSIIS